MTAIPRPDRSEQLPGRRHIDRILGVDLLTQRPDANDGLCGEGESLSRMFEYLGHRPKDTSAQSEEALPIDIEVNLAPPID
jgi:hypothetical protein